MDQDEGLTAVDNIVTQFNTYEDFLDSQITTVDLYYLEDESLARQLVELGYRGTGEIVKREDFEARKAAIDIARLAERTQKKALTSAGKELQDNFLKALAMREEDNRNGKVSTVIFIRDKNSHGQEVSGYIDYAHRLKTEDFEVYFTGKRRLLPRPTDMRLSQVTTLPESPSRRSSTHTLFSSTTFPEGRLKQPIVNGFLIVCYISMNSLVRSKVES
ncbi:cilia- and flagella-associated protein 299 isoform X2 [Peromyscus maniculatus bairdii]|uniref:cilia- and flagella-associated protein 299 isoform X2 n=1 Tax=Peromyscus maniculatus bairdii TaxID=230844 RepID=UPI001C2EA0FF|nr:cilia- and flagella-associated protein 299 isoform X2 [Peromyscus maniculatus bairdii]